MKKITSKFTLALMAGAVLAIGMSSCSKSSGGGAAAPQPLGGYISSDSVASANLIAYFPFDADANDHKGGLTASAVGSGVTFSSKGVRGNAYQGKQGAYFTLALPSGGGAYTNIGSYSESFWFNVAAQDTVTQGIFFVSGTKQQGEMITEIEPFKPVKGDSIKIHTGFIDINSAGFQFFVPETFDTAAIGKWVHMVITYNGGTSTYIVYQNAAAMGTNTAFSPAAPNNYNTPNVLYKDAPPVNLLGNIGFTSDPPTVMNIGSWPDGMFGQNAAKAAFTGQMDELRIFNRALTQQEVAGLFLNGQAGR